MRIFVWIPIFLATATLVYPADLDPARLAAAGDNAPALRGFAEVATLEFGQPGARAAGFLMTGMPGGDLRALSQEFLLENLRLAFRARQEFSWAREVPDDLFLDFVLPYAQLDEPRDPWRSQFHRQCRIIVKDCKTASQAAQAINATLFQQLGVKYDTGRKRPNQSPKESIEQGKASCTGLSIILADACRSVGIPARLAGIARWTHKQGNHTWVEVWDGSWHFAGAAEPSPEGLDHAWFQGDASQAVRDQPAHAIWANAWAPTQNHFPLAWDPSNTCVPAVNVTDHYAVKPAGLTEDGAVTLHLRVLDDQGQRVAARVGLLDSDGQILSSVTTKAGTADLNDMPALELKPGRPATLQVQQGEQTRNFPVTAQENGTRTLDLTWSKGAPAAETSDQGYHLVWADEFNKDGPPNAANWKFENGFVRNSELQWYQPQNAICKDGNLIIEARREHKANPNFKKQSKGWQTNREFIEYTSSCLITRGLHSWKFGRFEVRAKVRTQDGLWPAIWFLGTGGAWPNCGEIDLMEYYQGLILANACWGSTKRSQAMWDSSKKKVSSFGDSKWDERFHVWRMDWDSAAIQLYLDDVLLNTIDLTKTLNPTGEGPENPFLQPQYLLLNLAIGGTCGGNPSQTTFPSRFEIDYVRVYQKNPGGK